MVLGRGVEENIRFNLQIPKFLKNFVLDGVQRNCGALQCVFGVCSAFDPFIQELHSTDDMFDGCEVLPLKELNTNNYEASYQN